MIISADTPEELCPAGHQLRKFTTASDGYRCDGCGNQFPTGTVLRGCRQCDYDVCSDCVGKGTVIKVRDAPAIRAPGTRVRLKGVTGAPEFNGKLGETAAYDPERGRQHVVLDDDGGTIWVRLECMEDADLATDGLAGAELADEPTASPGLADKPTASLGSTASAPRISKGLSSGGLSPGTTPAELGRVLLGAAFLPDAPSIGSKVEVNCPGLAAFTGTIRGITDEKVDIMENVEGGRIFRMPVEILSQPDVCRVVKDTDLGPSGPLTNGGSLTNGSGPRNSISPEYALLMELFGEELQKLTMKSLFDFIDDDKNGKLSIDELEGRMPLINELMRRRDGATSDLTLDTLAIDEDGNGVISFHEFAEWAGPRLGLSLGMKLDFSACGILGCPCHEYRPCQKPRLKRGRTGLGRLIESVRKEFAGADKFPRCRCGHKISAHNIRNRTVGEIPFPDNWIHRCGDFTELVPAQNGPFMFGVDKFQAVVDYTYRNTWTRDRKKHNPSSPNVPRGFRVTGVRRCENSRNWTEYIFKNLRYWKIARPILKTGWRSLMSSQTLQLPTICTMEGHFL